MNTDAGQTRTRVRPGSILRAMGADAEAVTAPSFEAAERLTGAECSRARVEVERQGDRVVRILAHCRCGDVIRIECDYDDGGALR